MVGWLLACLLACMVGWLEFEQGYFVSGGGAEGALPPLELTTQKGPKFGMSRAVQLASS